MVAITSWNSGRGEGITYGTLINSSDISTLANGSTCLSTVADIQNGISLDMFMDISFSLSIASSTIASGATIAFWLYPLNQDGTTYGDGQLTAGTPSAVTPTMPVSASFVVPAKASTTTMVGSITGIQIPPGSFRVAIQNNCGFALSGTQTIKYRTYNIRGDNLS